LFALLGLRSAQKLPVDAVPDVTNVQVQIITSAPALSPAEVEKYVTVPVERSMAGIPRTSEIRSLSKYGLSVVTVAFEDGTDIYFARQLVSERMREATEVVPEQYGRPEMGPISSGLGEIFQFVVQNDALSLMQLEELLDWQIAPVLRGVPASSRSTASAARTSSTRSCSIRSDCRRPACRWLRWSEPSRNPTPTAAVATSSTRASTWSSVPGAWCAGSTTCAMS
jgi:multidrug efflux pump subunit AcrB